MWEKCEEERINKIERKARSGNTLGIIGTIGTGLALTNGGGGLLSGLIGGNRGVEQAEIYRMMEKENSDYVELTKGWYEGQIANLKELYAIRQNDVAEKFGLYQGTNLLVKSLQSQVDELKLKVAVGEAVRPYQDKILMDAISREAEARCCADQRIVCYGNQTYATLYTASQEPGSTTVTYTQKPIYDPLCSGACRGGMM